MVCERVVQGKKISQTEFEEDVCEYAKSCKDTRGEQIISLDLHMALETPTVFEFLVKAEPAK